MRRRRGKRGVHHHVLDALHPPLDEVAERARRSGQAEARVQVGPAEVGVDEDDALAEPRELPAEGGGQHGLADAALAAADRPDLTPLRARQRQGGRPAHRRVTLPSTASSRARVGADFFHSGAGAKVMAQSETPSPTMVTLRCRHCVAPRMGLS